MVSRTSRIKIPASGPSAMVCLLPGLKSLPALSVLLAPVVLSARYRTFLSGGIAGVVLNAVLAARLVNARRCCRLDGSPNSLLATSRIVSVFPYFRVSVFL